MKKIITLIAGSVALGMTANAQLTNTGLETWQNFNVSSVAMEGPTGWSTSDSVIGTYGALIGGAKKQTYKSTDMHGGSFAAALVARTYGGALNRALPAVLTNATITVDLATQSYQASGGTPITQRVNSATAWLKFLPKGTDTATFGVNAVIAGAGAGGKDSIVGSGTVKLTGSSAYTQVTVPVTYINSTILPNRVQIAFIAGSVSATVDSSVLLVDDVSMVVASGVRQVVFNADVVKVFPNPASGVLNLTSKEAEQLTWEAMAANGQLITSKEFTKSATVSLTNIPAGMYFFRVLNKDKELVQTGKFMVK